MNVYNEDFEGLRQDVCHVSGKMNGDDKSEICVRSVVVVVDVQPVVAVD